MALLRPFGELDLATVEPFRRELQAILDGQPTELVIDLCDVTFLDSSGIAVLATALRSQRARDAELVLVNPQPIVQRALVLVGLGTLIGVD
jgi:anti-sigma B factor antagonist